MRFFIILFFIFLKICFGFGITSFKPLEPISYNKQKALLGKKLFEDTNLSTKQDISCAKCHDISISYSGVARLVDVGLDKDKNYNPNIPYPSVINAGYNYIYYHDASIYRMQEQVKKSFENVIEMNSSKEHVEKMLNLNNDYVKYFKLIYNKKPNYEDVIDAIVEFEKSLVSLNSKFDKYLKGEEKLSDEELEGFGLFKAYACDTCHSGMNLGGNIVAKLNDNNYSICSENLLQGYYNVTKDKVDLNYIRVPSLRNVSMRLRHSHGSDDYMEKVIFKMVFCKLGLTPDALEVDKIISFLHTLHGERPKILDEEIK